MNRRRFISGLCGAPALGMAGLAAAGVGGASAQMLFRTSDLARSAAPVWEAWKAGYLRPDGRVVDRLQQNASHSEGQGYGMVLAAEFGDRDAFAAMFDWTERNLMLRADALLSWRYLPDADEAVPDRNNASDGDLFYAWALLRAARRFDERRYLDRVTDIAQALADTCIRPSPEDPARLLFLPAAQGFEHDGAVTINPSYLMSLAMNELAAATGVQALAECARDGELLLERLAQDGLVPDWVRISSDGVEPAEGFSQNAGYEAIRVPLFLLWSGLPAHPAVARMRALYEQTVRPDAPVPTVVEPVSGVVVEASDDPGYRALAAAISCADTRHGPGADIPAFDPSQPYYPATLQMFAMIAVNEVVPQCIPI